MFSERLTFEEKKNLVRLVAFMATADGVIDSREQLFIARITHRFSLRPEHFAVGNDDSLATLCEAFTREEARRIALIEILNVAHADGEYSDDERQEMRFLAELLGVDESVLIALEGWVAEGADWRRRGAALLSTD